ncbi:Alpha and gamma adaptin binding protein p34 [Fragilaria crotonensis]|nr:Alpha and gamma adaptin binding protein p34 [Fragilaria crotonensis]
MTLSCTSVLRVGGPSRDVTLLLTNALLHYFFPSDDDNKDTENNNADNKEDRNVELPSEPLVRLQNKYFSASILVSELLQDVSMDYIKEDGVVLVFDALKCNPDLDNSISFDALESLHNHADSVIACGDLLRLCVGVSLGQYAPHELRGKDHEHEYSKRILWCLDRGYEYVEVDLSQTGQLTGHDDRDKEGFARVIEAIQGTVWSSAVMKPREPVIESQQSSATTTTTAATTTTMEPTENPTPVEKEVNGYEPPDPEAIGAFLKVPEPIDEDYLDEAKTPEESMTRAAHEEDAKAFQELEGLMKEATRIRDMSRNGDLSDDVRRQRAAEAATLMLGLMEKMGIDDTDEEDSDS